MSFSVHARARLCWFVVTISGYSLKTGDASTVRKVPPVSPKYASNVLFSARMTTTCNDFGSSFPSCAAHNIGFPPSHAFIAGSGSRRSHNGASWSSRTTRAV